MVPEFALRLRLAAAVLRCETRKDLASAFRRVNPNTSFDLDRADKWLSGKALPRTTDIYRDWAKLLALDRAAEWLTRCAIDDLLDALAARYDTTPDAILQRARGFPRGAPAPDAVGRGDSGSSFVESAYACYQYAFTPYYPGRLVRGSLVTHLGSRGVGNVSGAVAIQKDLSAAFAPAPSAGPGLSSLTMRQPAEAPATATEGNLAIKERPEADRIAEARVKGYEGEDCRECGNFTLVRNGTCLKCDTCGSTSGCS